MQKVRVGINGFGRIGRQVFRALHAKYQDKVEVVAINDLFDAETNFHLLEYETNYGRANLDAVVEGDNATVGDWKIHCFAERDPKILTWGAYGVDVVVESTGIFRSAKQAHVHIEDALVVGVGVHGGHRTGNDPEEAFHDEGYRSEAVRGARGVGNDMVLGRIVVVVVYAHDDGEILFLRH